MSTNILGGVMVPHPPLAVPAVGCGKEEKIKDTIDSYRKVSKIIGEYKPDTIILISPHSSSFNDAFNIFSGSGETGDFSNFGAGEVSFEVSYDEEFFKKLVEVARDVNFPINIVEEERLDHGVMIPLYFLNEEYTDYKLVRLSLAGFSTVKHYEYGMLLQKVARELGRRYFVIASGDLSHRLLKEGPYGLHPDGPIYDERIMKDMECGNFYNLMNYPSTFLDNAAICGHKGFAIMGGIFDGMDIKSKKYSYEGPYGVGYGVCSYDVVGVDDERHFLEKWRNEKREEIKNKSEDKYIRLARETINNYIRNGSRDIDVSDEGLLNNKAGVFVSIHKDGFLRGCIGTIIPTTDSIASEIINNAVSAATRDFRFSPITEDELDYLEISVDVLGEAEEVSDILELNVKKYGIIVSFNGKRGLLLPNLDNVNTVDEQISVALRKGGIDKNDDYKIERFEVVRHE